jgi:hypothetical protein
VGLDNKAVVSCHVVVGIASYSGYDSDAGHNCSAFDCSNIDDVDDVPDMDSEPVAVIAFVVAVASGGTDHPCYYCIYAAEVTRFDFDIDALGLEPDCTDESFPRDSRYFASYHEELAFGDLIDALPFGDLIEAYAEILGYNSCTGFHHVHRRNCLIEGENTRGVDPKNGRRLEKTRFHRIVH